MDSGTVEQTKIDLVWLQELARRVKRIRRGAVAGAATSPNQVFPSSVVSGSPEYIQKISHQINSAFEHELFDSCLLMMRKLVEALIIDLFESRGDVSKIQTSAGDFHTLISLVNKVVGEQSWNLARDTRKALVEVKKLGDNSAHNRRFTARRGDIESVRVKFRVAVEELVRLSKGV